MPDEQAGRRQEQADQSGEVTETEADLEQIRADLERARADSEEHYRLLQRAQADLINYRRRVEQERGDAIRGAKADVMLTFLPVLDDFELALRSVPADVANLPWVQGLTLIERKLRAAVEATGATPIEAMGKQFDPWEHEAVMYEESPGHEEGEITGVLRPGYKLQGRIIRPAQVKVAKERNAAKRD